MVCPRLRYRICGLPVKLKDYIQKEARKTAKFERGLASASKKAQTQTLEKGMKMASGGVSLSELRRRDHPFATRHGSPMMPLLPVNKHRGDFYRSFYASGSEGRLTVVNDARVAKWLDEGTRVMFGRHFRKFLEGFATKVVRAEVARAVKAYEAT